MGEEVEYFSVKIQDIPDLMRWGRDIMREYKVNSIKEENSFFRVMIIFDCSVVENGDDEDELLVMSISNGGVLESKKDYVCKDFLKPLVQNNTFKTKINFQEATVVYFLMPL